MNVARRAGRARGGRRVHPARPGAAALRRRRDRADEPARCRSRPTSTTPAFRAVTFDQRGDAYAEQVRGAARRRRRPAAARDDLRHAQHEGRALRDRGGLRRARRARAGDALGARSPTAAAARSRARRSRRSGTRSRTRSRSRSALNCALGADEMRPYVEELAARRADCFISLLPERRACPTRSASTTRRPRRRRRVLARVRARTAG